MKIKMLVASGLCLALSFQIFAQENTLPDSIYIVPFAGCKVVLVGKNISKILKENNLEVLKNKFIEDYRESSKEKDFPAQAKNIIYLASQDGRRRLKAAPDEDIPMNIENEIKAFKSDLPSFHYTIYDLMNACEYHIYVKEPEELEKLAVVNCTRLLSDAAGTEVSGLKKYVSIEIGPSDSGFAIKKQRGNTTDVISISGFVGASLINNSFSPTIGLEAEFTKMNKYRKPDFKIGYGYSVNVLADYQNKSFTNFYKFYSLNVYSLKNISSKKEDFWLGISAGRFFTDNVFGSARTGTLDKAWKFGIVTQFKSIGLEFNAIRDRHKNGNAAITLRYYF